ncbi:MAG TPA: hypothetical protein VLV85_00480 [Stellaceae bacterium]|jgi:hypothetical protein|nr:hypothetical protein [Stellaceae bacterium]
MSNANINDRSSIERIYPRAVFLRESTANARAKASVLRGLHILAGADAVGRFGLVRAAHRASEPETSSGVFLCPSASSPEAAETADPYDAFLDRVIATARATQPSGAAERDD